MSSTPARPRHLFAAALAGLVAVSATPRLASPAAPVPAPAAEEWAARHAFACKNAVTAVALGPVMVVVGEESGALTAWDAGTGMGQDVILVPQDSHRPYDRLQLSPDGELFYALTNGRSNFQQGRVTRWMGKDRHYLGVGTGGAQVVFGVTADGGHWLHAEAKKRAVLMLSANPMPDGCPLDAEPAARFEHKEAVALAAAAGADAVVSVSGGALRRWAKGDGKPAWEAKLDGLDPTALAAHPAGKAFAVGGAGGEARVYGPTGKLVATLKGHAGKVQAVALSADGRRVATGGADGAVRVYDAGTGKGLAVLTGHPGGVLAVAFGPDGKALVSGGADKAARVWELKK